MFVRFSYREELSAQERIRYRKIGYDAYIHGVDRRVADDFPTQYRSSFKAGWDQANADALFIQISKLTLKCKHKG